ncbi:MAG: hypothetical protein ACSLFP_17345 [Acidimicrobiales bacterium]
MTQVHEHRTAFTAVSDTIRDLRDAEVRLREEQEATWRRYLKEVDQILAADLRCDDRSREVDLIDHELLAGLRGRLDDLRVQAKLATMEGEDVLAQLRSTITRLTGHVHLPHH